jgi:hypothetical protein
MRAVLAEAEAVPEAAPAKHELVARAPDVETRTLEHAPTERAPDDDLEIPTAHKDAPTLARNRDLLRASRRVAPDDGERIDTRADICALVRV